MSFTLFFRINNYIGHINDLIVIGKRKDTKLMMLI